MAPEKPVQSEVAKLTDGQLMAALTRRKRAPHKPAVPARPSRKEAGTAKPTPEELAAAWKRWGKETKVIGTTQRELNCVASNWLSGTLFYGQGGDPETERQMRLAVHQAVEEIGPRDVIEGQIAQQMTVCWSAVMDCMRRANLPEQSIEGRDMNLKHAAKMMRTHAVLVDTLNKHRGKGQQIVRVERVNVEAGAQAIIGSNVTHQGGGVQQKRKVDP